MTHEFWLSLGVSILCGGMIGLEREIRDKPLGMRTCILICLGTQVFVRLGVGFDGAGADPSRVLGQVVTGIGFLGAGVIISLGRVLRGVTSASVVWVLAAIGATIGVGRHLEAIAVSVVTLAILTVLLGVERLMGRSDEEIEREGGNS